MWEYSWFRGNRACDFPEDALRSSRDASKGLDKTWLINESQRSTQCTKIQTNQSSICRSLKKACGRRNVGVYCTHKFETCDRALSKCLFRPTLMHLILIQNKHMLLIGKNHKSVQQLKIMLPWLWGQARKTCNAYLTLSFKKVHFCMKHWRTLTLANCHSSFIFLLLGLLKKCTQCPSNATTGH